MDALAKEGPLDTRQLALSVIRAKGLSTDANGNYTANLVGAVPGSNSVFVSVESLFQQALNGDGKIGPCTAVSGTLVEIGSVFLMKLRRSLRSILGTRRNFTIPRLTDTA